MFVLLAQVRAMVRDKETYYPRKSEMGNGPLEIVVGDVLDKVGAQKAVRRRVGNYRTIKIHNICIFLVEAVTIAVYSTLHCFVPRPTHSGSRRSPGLITILTSQDLFSINYLSTDLEKCSETRTETTFACSTLKYVVLGRRLVAVVVSNRVSILK